RRLQQRYVLECALALLETDPALQQLDRTEAEEAVRAWQEREAARPLYVVVGKILGGAETLPADWPTDGTTGYDFGHVINGLVVDTSTAGAFTRLYREATGVEEPFAELVYQSKLLVMRVTLSSEVHMLAQQLDALAQKGRSSRDFTLTSLRHALREVIACFPV